MSLISSCAAYVSSTISQSTRRSWSTSGAFTCSLRENMRVGVTGCAHGELDALYDAVKEAESVTGPLDLLLCPGDFQAVRNATDLTTMACPPKFRSMNSFWKYYSKASAAPVPTLFVGGNHEAANHLQELCYGGLVAPNMYYLGDAGVVSVRGLRIAGISGVFVQHNYNKPRYERPPYERSQLKSVYHARATDVRRLKRLQRAHIDIMMSHDWPKDIVHAGNTAQLLKHKPFLRSEINRGEFGHPGTKELLAKLQPRFWFAAHMHVKFAARVEHPGGKATKFLALDKILPKRDFLQVLEIPVVEDAERSLFVQNELSLKQHDCAIEMDPEWLAVLRSEVKEGKSLDRPVTDEEIEEIKTRAIEKKFATACLSSSDFERTAPTHDRSANGRAQRPTSLMFAPRTRAIADLIGVDITASDPQLSTLNPEKQADAYKALHENTKQTDLSRGDIQEQSTKIESAVRSESQAVEMSHLSEHKGECDEAARKKQKMTT